MCADRLRGDPELLGSGGGRQTHRDEAQRLLLAPGQLTRAASGKNPEQPNGQTKRSSKERVAETNGAFPVPGVSLQGLRDLEVNLQQTLGTQVKVRMKPDQSGEIAIDFYSLEDLERLNELIASVSAE